MHKSVLDYCAKWKRVIFFFFFSSREYTICTFSLFLEGGFSLVTQGRLEDPPVLLSWSLNAGITVVYPIPGLE